MTRYRFGRLASAVLLTALWVLLPSPAAAQVGTLTGKVVDASGKPVADAQVVFENAEDKNFRATTKTNAKGEYVQAGLPSAKGVWMVSATKDGITTGIKDLTVPFKAVAEVEPIVLKAGAAPAAGLSVPGGRGNAEAAKLEAELNKIFGEANAAISSNSFDAALAKFSEVIAKLPACDICYLRIGDVNVRKGDLPAAEAAYKKAVELDAKSVDGYEGLATVYNSQKKYTEAGEATKKASELRGAGGAGGGDATSFFNAGVIFWNQSKATEAAEQFEKAIKADSTMADAYYYYGMALINQGKVPEAKTQLQQYLKLAPTGQYADTAKSVLGSI